MKLLQYIDALHAAAAQAAKPNDDIEYLREELPPALTRVSDGLARVAEIVRSMKDFSHVDQQEVKQVDLNRAIQSKLWRSRNPPLPSLMLGSSA